MKADFWIPSQAVIESSRMYPWMKQLGFERYDDFHEASIRNIDWFWGEVEKVLDINWDEPYRQVVDLTHGIKWPQWYVNGKFNTVYNALDKWVADPVIADKDAIIWEDENGKIRRYTYREMSHWVERVAHGLVMAGIARGDRIGIYLPMIPETVVAVMAIAKIGALYTPVFSGLGYEPVAKRLECAEVKLLITADGYQHRGKIIAMKEEADRAVRLVPSVVKTVVIRSLGRDIPWNPERDMDWIQLEDNIPPLSAAVKTGSFDSEEPLMILYTSGTTGRPKGTIHTHAGFSVRSAFELGFMMDFHREDRLLWITDLGWIMGSFVIFGVFMNGGTLLLYNGMPMFPEPDRLWKLVADHRVSMLGVSPTLIRSLMPYGDNIVRRHDLRSLRILASTGEPWNPEAWSWLFHQVGKGNLPIINLSGGTEVGGAILTNTVLKPIGSSAFNTASLGMHVDVYDDAKHSIASVPGELVIKQPWLGMTKGLWDEPERYEKAYWQPWEDTWLHGDMAIRYEDGNWKITGRSDDIMNIAGKRMGPIELESVLMAYNGIREAVVCGVPDALKGETAVAFVVVEEGLEASPQLEAELAKEIAARLGKSYLPKAIYFVAELPKTSNGKIVRHVVKAAYLQENPGDLSVLANPHVIKTLRRQVAGGLNNDDET